MAYWTRKGQVVASARGEKPMQTTGTFPQLHRPDTGIPRPKPKPKAPAKKR